MLRGLAALAVVFFHALNVVRGTAAGTWIPAVIERTPLVVLQQGYLSVPLFFVLSGFVLAFVLSRDRTGPVLGFLVKRTMRIWLPFIACLLAFGLVRHCTVFHMPPNFGPWLYGHWTKPVSGWDFAATATLIGIFDPANYNSSVWTLVHEMRISLLFPLLMLALWGRRWPVYLLVALLLAKVGGYYSALYTETATHPGNLAYASLADTVQYAHYFVIGILLCQYRAAIIAHLRKLSPVMQGALAVVGVALYSGRVVQGHLPFIAPFDPAFLLGCTLLIGLAITCTESIILRWRPLVWLGRVSYSLYLWHSLFIITGTIWFGNRVPTWAILGTAIGLSLLVAELSYRYIELPTMTLGKRLSTWQRRPAIVTPPTFALQGQPVASE